MTPNKFEEFVEKPDNPQTEMCIRDRLKVLCDEIFGRQNYINMVSVNAKVSAGASGGGEDKRLKKNIEYILIADGGKSPDKQGVMEWAADQFAMGNSALLTAVRQERP